MKIEETVKGKDLRLEEDDLLTKTRKVHIVFNGVIDSSRTYGPRICRTSIIRRTERQPETEKTKKRGERLWKKVGECTDYTNYKRQVKGLGYDFCQACVNRLEAEGFMQD